MNKLTVPRHFLAVGQVTLCQLLLAFGLYFFLNEASAQVALTTSYTAYSQAEKTEGSNNDYRSLIGTASYGFAKIHTAKFYVEAEDYSDPKTKSQVVDLYGQYTIRAWEDKRKWNSLNLGLRVGAPTNDDHKLRTLQNYLRFNLSTVSTLNTISPDLSLTLRANFRRNNFKKTSFVTQDDDGKDVLTSNVSSSSGQGFDLSYSLNDKLSFGLSFTHVNLFYFDGPSLEYYTHNQSVDYAFTKNFSVTLAHTLAPGTTSAFNPDGTDYGIRGFEGENSYFSVGINLSI